MNSETDPQRPDQGLDAPITRFDGPHKWLSNFYPAKVSLQHTVRNIALVEGQPNTDVAEYASVEHAYQAAKFTNMEDRMLIRTFVAGRAKNHARAFAHKQKGWDQAHWQVVSLSLMEQLLRQKFADPLCRALLIETGNTLIEEGNWWHDNFFGNCHCARCPEPGLNHLGKLLMHLRLELLLKGTPYEKLGGAQ